MDCETHLGRQRCVYLRSDEMLCYWEDEEGARSTSISITVALCSGYILEYVAQTAPLLNQNLWGVAQ